MEKTIKHPSTWEGFGGLSIYSASAGSGKTFTLAKRYIELLIEDPTSYRQTLAVTFTNKATEEMKMRILEQLYGLWKGLDSSKPYLEQICKDMKVETACAMSILMRTNGKWRMENADNLEKFVARRAGMALGFMLHDYSMFQVQTIDAFFQRVMRNLARELDLSANLRVDLNDKEREQLAVDSLINELSQGDEKLRWILSFVEDKMMEDKSWDVIKDIKDFGTKIFSDDYKENAAELKERFQVKGFFSNLKKQLSEIVSDTDHRMVEYGEQFEEELQKAGYSVDCFSRKTGGAAGYFLKLKAGKYYDKDAPFNTYAQAGAAGPEGWLTKKQCTEGSAIYAFVSDVLVPLINKAENERCEMQAKAASAKLVLQNLNQLRLLYYISQKVREMNTDENSIQLSDTQNVLKALMKDSDAPFVFEKIGSKLKNIMIDEFQDTSTTQWSNFKKLIMECLSQSGSKNLVVGDVKQSIYRWRNGDWRLLHGLSGDRELSLYHPESITLDTNYRSEQRIIEFNNSFFLAAAPVEQRHLTEDGNPEAALISEIYKLENVKQKVPEGKEGKEGKEGYVSITLLPSEEYQNETIKLIEEQISSISEIGGRDEDIAILVRDNTHISLLAQQLQEDMPEHQFVSDEAFKLYSSPELTTITDAMRLLLNPQSPILLKKLEPHEPQQLLAERQRLLSLPLIDLCYELQKIFSFQFSIFTSQFMDAVSDFCQQNTPDLQQFLNQWDEAISQKSVQGGEIKGIRLLTIHKSKGLEYENVIIPFCDWQLYKGSTIWCKSEVEPFSSLPVIPVLSTSLKGTIYSREYHYERLQDCIDNLNLLYVAFTRASRNLFVIGKQTAKNSKSKNNRSVILQEVLPTLTETLQGSTWEGNVFTWGDIKVKNEKSKNKSEENNILSIESVPLELSHTTVCSEPEFIQSNASKRFFEIEDSLDIQPKANTQHPTSNTFITLGIVMHNLLSEIHGLSEAEGKLDEFVQSGIVSAEGEGLNREKMAHLLETRLFNNKLNLVKSWFAEDNVVMNECSILCKDSEGHLVEKRPDRVVQKDGKVTVIDFKFSTPKPEHKLQVREYMNLIQEVQGARFKVQGYLWYVYQNQVLEC